mmetsp:Transcript_6302/g.39253  ORF Transcript_6302/g.39253 Transcript_6302/m.39253 type:complete len:81 (+) Transcript_6302:4546-4788(+)
MKPYSVNATKAIGTVEMKHPAMGMNEQMNTNRVRKTTPGSANKQIPAQVKAVFTQAMVACACKAFPNKRPKEMKLGATSL